MERPPGPKVTLTTGPQDVANQTHPSTPGLPPSRRGPPPGSSSASNCATLPTRPGRCPPVQGVSVKTRKAERDSGQVAALARSLGRPPVHRSLQFPFVWDSDAQGDQRQEEAVGGGARPPPPPWTWICAQSCSTIYSGLEAAGMPAAGRPPAHKDERGGREGPDCSRGGVSKATPAGRRFGALPVALPTLALPLPSREENVRATASAGSGEEAARGGKDPAGDQGRGSEGPAPPRAPRPPPGAARGARGTTTRGSPTQSALPPPRARRGPQTEGEYGRTRDARAALTSSPTRPSSPRRPQHRLLAPRNPRPHSGPLRRSPQSHGSPSPTSTQTPTPLTEQPRQRAGAGRGGGGRGARQQQQQQQEREQRPHVGGAQSMAAAPPRAPGAAAVSAPDSAAGPAPTRPAPPMPRPQHAARARRPRPRPAPSTGSGPRNVLRPTWPPTPPNLCGRPAPPCSALGLLLPCGRRASPARLRPSASSTLPPLRAPSPRPPRTPRRPKT